ncbi:protein kinase domain-containing protein [Streptomyces sp. WMMC897]|uniref:serine/threonine-protein kinase n=1 Tax=Streptomyces sp. WMMC897 TaxID=3014782 RepID=UPI0022B67482|nr:serine/threonine-protein kinase [Streptomyces sp. WMMC897]MCZ7417615.1 protein kinase [Streptomyces sp. WMMC897]
MLRPLDAHAPYDVGPYRLLAGLGAGGMGSVHLALPPDGGPDELVALKTIRSDLAPELEGDFRLRFRREARAARAVRSPYVSALVDTDPDAERPWLATEYVVGPSLDEAVARAGALPVPVVREMGADLARGLAAVHGARLVHRDLKPANVVLDSRGPRLIDFGIAKAHDVTALTATGVLVGSPGFMSPEHIAGDGSVTSGSDVFCLGAVLCFAATGQGPFQDSEFAAIVHRIAQGDADLSRLPEQLRDIVTACLHRDPDQRPTPAELVRRLDPAAEAAARPVASSPRAAPFPWPDGVREVIGEYETAVGRVLNAPPSPQRPPIAAAAPPASDIATALPPAVAPRRRRLRWAVAGGAMLLAGALTAVLLPLLSDADGAGAGRAERPSLGPADDAGSEGTGESAVPVVASTMRDFGPDALDRSRLPEAWSPWTASFEGSGEPLDCALGGTALVCRLHNEDSDALWLEALNASDGSPLWRYPAEDGTAGNSGVAGLDLDADHAYVTSADGDGFAILSLDDGEVVGKIPGETGYRPSTARVHEGRVFVSYTGSGGAGTALNMLFRAYSADDRRLQWERVINSAFPNSLDIVGDRVWVHGPVETLTLDPATGDTLARFPEFCPLPARGARHAICPDGVLDARTLRRVSDVRTVPPAAVSRAGLAIAQGPGRRRGLPYLRAVDLRTGREQWSVTTAEDPAVLVAGGRVLTMDGGGVRSLELDSGEGMVHRTYSGWPRENTSGGSVAMRPTTAMVSGGALFVTFADGTVLSVHVP